MRATDVGTAEAHAEIRLGTRGTIGEATVGIIAGRMGVHETIAGGRGRTAAEGIAGVTTVVGTSALIDGATIGTGTFAGGDINPRRASDRLKCTWDGRGGHGEPPLHVYRCRLISSQ